MFLLFAIVVQQSFVAALDVCTLQPHTLVRSCSVAAGQWCYSVVVAIVSETAALASRNLQSFTLQKGINMYVCMFVCMYVFVLHLRMLKISACSR